MPSEMPSEAETLGRVVRWAEEHPLVRAVILESSRAVGQAAIDRFSDYDILLVVADVRLFADEAPGSATLPSHWCALATH